MNWEGKDKRKFPRGEVYFKVFCYNGDNCILSSYSDNVSDGGLKAVFEEEIPVGTELRLELYVDEEPLICRGRIAWTRKIVIKDKPGVFYETGIQFLMD